MLLRLHAKILKSNRFNFKQSVATIYDNLVFCRDRRKSQEVININRGRPGKKPFGESVIWYLLQTSLSFVFLQWGMGGGKGGGGGTVWQRCRWGPCS